MIRVALIGPIGAGKTTLFSGITGIPYHEAQKRQPEGHAFGTVAHADWRLDELFQQTARPRKVPASLELVDAADLIVEGTDRQKNYEALAKLRELDGLVVVVPCFRSSTALGTDSSPRSPQDVRREIGEIQSELLVADLAIIESRLKRLDAILKKPVAHTEKDREERQLLGRLRDALERNLPISSVARTEEENRLLRGYGFLSQKPNVLVLNLAEQLSGSPAGGRDPWRQEFPDGVPLWVKLECELCQTPVEERRSYLESYGLTELRLASLSGDILRGLGLLSFFTIGDDEVRAWLVRKGDDAVTAAGKIHTDMARGFICAEVISFDHWKASGGLKEARVQGKIRLEGKTYVVQDGDIVKFRFHVSS